MGEGKVWLLFLFFLSYYVRSTGREIDFLNATAPAGVAWILSSSLKRLFKRPRPYQALNLPRPKAKYWNDSMPSSHAATTFAFAVTLLLMGHVLALPFVVWATLVSFSRLYLGLHFMSDVFFGALLGTGVAFGIYNYIF